VADNKFNADWLISNWDEIWNKASSFKPVTKGEFSASEIIGKMIIDYVENNK
jgi:hypothetical protein